MNPEPQPETLKDQYERLKDKEDILATKLLKRLENRFTKIEDQIKSLNPKGLILMLHKLRLESLDDRIGKIHQILNSRADLDDFTEDEAEELMDELEHLEYIQDGLRHEVNLITD